MTDDIDYKQLFLQQQITIQTLQQTIEQQSCLLQNLQQQIEQLLRAQYGKKSERQAKQRNRPKSKPPSKASEEEPSNSNRKLPEHFERVEVLHDVSEDKKQCPNCEIPLDKIKPITYEQLSYRPATLFVKKHVRCRYACRQCSQTIITAAMPNQPIEKGIADASLLAQVVIDKYQDHLPLYRQENRWLRQGIALSRSTLCDWVTGCGALIKSHCHRNKKRYFKS